MEAARAPTLSRIRRQLTVSFCGAILLERFLARANARRQFMRGSFRGYLFGIAAAGAARWGVRGLGGKLDSLFIGQSRA